MLFYIISNSIFVQKYKYIIDQCSFISFLVISFKSFLEIFPEPVYGNLSRNITPARSLKLSIMFFATKSINSCSVTCTNKIKLMQKDIFYFVLKNNVNITILFQPNNI